MDLFKLKTLSYLTAIVALGTYGCSSNEVAEPEPQEVSQETPTKSIPVQKKVLYSQRSNEGKNAINLIEEQMGNRRALRIIVQRGDLSSNLVHPIDSPNFVIAIPLQDATTKQFAQQTIQFEQQLNKELDELLERYLAKERFNVSLEVQWNQQLLEEIQLRSVPMDIPVTELKASGKITQMLYEENGKNLEYPELETAVQKIKFKVLLDSTLPSSQEKFVKQLIPTQDFFSQIRGDSLSLERTSFPNPFNDSIAPYEEQVITKKIKELIEQYISPKSYVLNVDFAVIDNTSDDGEVGPTAMKMSINLLLDDIILPEVDTFLKNALPLAVDFKPDDGDSLTIVRNRFPETSIELITQEQVSALQDYRKNIEEAFKTGDYVSGLELAEKGLRVAGKREDKIFLYKMKGSLHFLLEEKQRALETWKHVQRLDPKDTEIAQMLSNLE